MIGDIALTLEFARRIVGHPALKQTKSSEQVSNTDNYEVNKSRAISDLKCSKIETFVGRTVPT